MEKGKRYCSSRPPSGPLAQRRAGLGPTGRPRPAAFGQPVPDAGAGARTARAHRASAVARAPAWRGYRRLPTRANPMRSWAKRTRTSGLHAATPEARRGGREGGAHRRGGRGSGNGRRRARDSACGGGTSLRCDSLAAIARGGHEMTNKTRRRRREARRRALTGEWRTVAARSGVGVEGGGLEL
jgi:hypothetical protein